MSVRNDKDKIIREIMNLRTLIDEITVKHKIDKKVCFIIDEASRDIVHKHLNKIHNMVFNI